MRPQSTKFQPLIWKICSVANHRTKFQGLQNTPVFVVLAGVLCSIWLVAAKGSIPSQGWSPLVSPYFWKIVNEVAISHIPTANYTMPQHPNAKQTGGQSDRLVKTNNPSQLRLKCAKKGLRLWLAQHKKDTMDEAVLVHKNNWVWRI